MKISKHILLAAIFCGNCVATQVFAIDLMDVYKQAFATDPTFKAARAQFLADKEGLPIARSALFPKLNATGNLTRQYTRNESAVTTNSSGRTDYFDNNVGYGLQLTQPLFSFGNWAGVWGAQAKVKQAEATFLAAEEDLLSRTAQAYFNVLLAKDVLYYTKSNKVAVERLLNQTKHKYDVGLIAITDLENTRAKYDQAVSDEIKAINDLSDNFEQLNEITGVRYFDLDPIKANFPLLSPQPNDIEQWVKAAEKHNFDLAAARYAAIVAKENIKVQNAGHLPTLSAKGQYAYSYDDNANYPGTINDGFNRAKKTSAGLELAVPIFQGGGVVAAAKQADYQYQEKLAEQNKAYRSTISKTRKVYLGVLSNISKIKADLQAIKSAQNYLRSIEANYNVGTRTMTDVLDAQTALYNVQKIFADDEYKYIMQLLTLKQLVGILDAGDLKQINAWLKKQSMPAGKVIVATKGKRPGLPHPANNAELAMTVRADTKNTANTKVVVLNTEEVKQVAANNNVVTAPASAAVVVVPVTAVKVAAAPSAPLAAPLPAPTVPVVPAVSTVPTTPATAKAVVPAGSNSN